MALTAKQLGQGRYNNTTNNIVYSVPAETTAIVTAVNLCNTTSSDVTVRLFYTPSGATVDQTTAVLYDFIIPANDYHSFSPEKPHNLEAGGSISFQNGTANGVTITVSGAEKTSE